MAKSLCRLLIYVKHALVANFFTSQICILMLLAKISFSWKYPNIKYLFVKFFSLNLCTYLFYSQGVRFDPDLPQTLRLEFAKSNTKVTKPKQQSPQPAATHPTLIHPITGRKLDYIHAYQPLKCSTSGWILKTFAPGREYKIGGLSCNSLCSSTFVV